MSRYAILGKLEWDHATPIHEHPGARIVPFARLAREFDSLVGRLRGGILVQKVPT